MATKENIMAAYAGESQANRRYAAFAEKADEEGLPVIGRLFRAASEAEAIHARRLLTVAGAVGKTDMNLQASMEGETHEFTEMYPAFVKEGEAEKETEAVRAFTYAMKAEEVHATHYREALAALKGGRDLAVKKIFLCPVCGNIFFDTPPERCPICSVAKKIFREIT